MWKAANEKKRLNTLISTQTRIIAKQKEEIKALRGELEAATGYGGAYDAGWARVVATLKLTGQQERILRTLYNHEIANKRTVYDALYWDRQDCELPDDKILDVFIFHIRKKLPANSIKTLWGRGWLLTDLGRACVAATMIEAADVRAA